MLEREVVWMSGVRSKRVKLLEGMCRTISDRLHERVAEAARRRGQPLPPETTSAVYALAMAVAPGLLDQLLCVYQLLTSEPGARRKAAALKGLGHAPGELERRQMLSAVRATVGRSRLRGRLA